MSNSFKLPKYGNPPIEQDVRAAVSLVHNTFRVLKKNPTLEEINKFCSVRNFPKPTGKDFVLAIEQKYITLEKDTYILNEIAKPLVDMSHSPNECYPIKKKDFHHVCEVNRATRDYLGTTHKKEAPAKNNTQNLDIS